MSNLDNPIISLYNIAVFLRIIKDYFSGADSVKNLLWLLMAL